ncbi:UDP-N-acetylglucosamine diphosphorylase/glucosamine-1-phosphate N-acetyltransferase [Legionella taurinensis]|uniref:Bifunctional protein GlmU n=1 Tax=Legionella taurinensis TaxID=70611 RepID=A0A3A5LCI8_9GAMM|nr:bifunctional UDP-N-acetylglucosamine diphosphorylase/glucosamine-1-phosphate N-acetyltransferase GlmU [Legionella taurinensis]MDX1836110.1 bifunctional UDP-N-acetylglucosamine diphosphorylase/glucosamine-1-phosphate N-acetyltransferase GlmU [Legionella taurinensis]PUT42116.1 UDP-N-acetylglucosamine diphosphorylase/glucosamine-1-phosphate N-acetyltransferase [Legionella taurinensis]PUT44903.1 UDP-N-acetylglucosamine diphosphorylase/glucosamine-1-phosphate N-acetyltransferase [Legionella taurin
MSLEIVILAAGMGKRMYSDLPKVLHPLAGKPMLERVVETAQQLRPQAIHVIYGHGGQQIKEALSHLSVNWVVQEQQLGTGHALLKALPHLNPKAQVLVLSGDVPLIQADTLKALVTSATDAQALTLLLATLEDPTGLGRIVRNPNKAIEAIVEEKDATPKQRQIREIYSGICCARVSDLARWLPRLTNDNAQGEYYLTEIITLAVNEGQTIGSMPTPHVFEIQGVNNRLQLQQLERIWQQYQAEKLMLQGIGIADAARIDIRGELECGKDVFIDVNCVFSGKVTLGKGSRIGPHCTLTNVTLGEHCEVLGNSVLDGAVLGDHCQVGPFARLRPGTRLAEHCKIGNFVETKNAVFDTGSKASHLSYLGDVTLGKKVNVGAGTITCNYDGVNKHQTIIEDGVFIGSDTQLVAPVTVGAHATIGAGSTIRKNVPSGELTLTESRQKTVFGWKRPIKKEQ